MFDHYLIAEYVAKTNKFSSTRDFVHLFKGRLVAAIAAKIAFLDEERHDAKVKEENIQFFVHSEKLCLLRVQEFETSLEIVHHLRLVLLALVHTFGNKRIVMLLLRLRP